MHVIQVNGAIVLYSFKRGNNIPYINYKCICGETITFWFAQQYVCMRAWPGSNVIVTGITNKMSWCCHGDVIPGYGNATYYWCLHFCPAGLGSTTTVLSVIKFYDIAAFSLYLIKRSLDNNSTKFIIVLQPNKTSCFNHSPTQRR